MECGINKNLENITLCKSCADPEGVGGGGGGGGQKHKWLSVSLEILVGTPLEKQLDPSLLLEGGRCVPL